MSIFTAAMGMKHERMEKAGIKFTTPTCLSKAVQTFQNSKPDSVLGKARRGYYMVISNDNGHFINPALDKAIYDDRVAKLTWEKIYRMYSKQFREHSVRLNNYTNLSYQVNRFMDAHPESL